MTEATDSRLPARAYSAYVLVLLSVVSFVSLMDRMVLGVLIEQIKRDLHFSDTQLGALSGIAFALFYATLGVPVARLADRSRRVPILSIAVALWSAATATCGLAVNFLQMFVARVAVGVGEAGCVPASHSLISDYFRPNRRAYALGLFQAGGNLGVMVGAIGAGILATRFGWRVTFFCLGIPGVVIGLTAALTLKEPARGRFETTPTRNFLFREAFWTLIRKATYRRVVLAYSLGLFCIYGMAQWIPAFFMRVHGASAKQAGIYFGMSGGAGSAVGALLGALIAPTLIRKDRRWELWLPGVAYAMAVPCLAFVFISQTMQAAAVFLFVGMTIASTGMGAGMASVQSVAEPQLRATAVALLTLCSALIGQGAGPVLVGAASDALAAHFGPQSLRVALLVSIVLVALGASQFFRAARSLPTDLVS